MKRSTLFALAAATGAGLFAGAAQAQDMREFDQTMAQRASNEDAVRLRFTLPFGQAEADRQDPRLSFGFAHDLGGGRMGNFDVVSFSLGGETTRVETPFAMRAAGDGSPWYTSPRNLLLLGVGVGVAWAIYDHNQDDDEEDTPPPS